MNNNIETKNQLFKCNKVLPEEGAYRTICQQWQLPDWQGLNI